VRQLRQNANCIVTDIQSPNRFHPSHDLKQPIYWAGLLLAE